MIFRLIKSITYTRKVYKISKELGGNQSFSLNDKATSKYIEEMKKLWSNEHEFLAPIIEIHEESVETLEKCYWDLSANGAGQWVGGYYVAVAALCFPVPMNYVLENLDLPKGQLASRLLDYFESGNPYLPLR